MTRLVSFASLFIAAVGGGGIVGWMQNEYGWESPRTIWAAVVAVFVLTIVNMIQLGARIARLEEQIRDRK